MPVMLLGIAVEVKAAGIKAQIAADHTIFLRNSA